VQVEKRRKKKRKRSHDFEGKKTISVAILSKGEKKRTWCSPLLMMGKRSKVEKKKRRSPDHRHYPGAAGKKIDSSISLTKKEDAAVSITQEKGKSGPRKKKKKGGSGTTEKDAHHHQDEGRKKGAFSEYLERKERLSFRGSVGGGKKSC